MSFDTEKTSPQTSSHVFDSSSPNRIGKPKTKLFMILMCIAATAVVFLALFTRHKKGPITADRASQPVIIHTVTAQQGDMGVYIDALGTVTPISTVNVYSQVSGQIVAVHYREGQIVHKGDPLLDIDPRPYQAQLQQAEGLLDHDKGVLNQAEIDLARYKEAFTSHAVAKQILDDQEQAVVQDRGAVKYDLGQVQYAEVQLGYCHIAAPASGRIGLRLVDAGNTIFAGSSTPLAVITELQPITVVFNVAEDHLRDVQEQIRRQKTLSVEALDRSAQTRLATGRLLTLDNQVDTSTGTVRFRGEFNNPDLALFPNEFVNTRLLLRTIQKSVLIPSDSIQRNGAQAFVFLIVNQRASVRDITEQSSDGRNTSVIGLQVGDVVALSGFDKLQDGTSVTVEQEAQEKSSNPEGGN